MECMLDKNTLIDSYLEFIGIRLTTGWKRKPPRRESHVPVARWPYLLILHTWLLIVGFQHMLHPLFID